MNRGINLLKRETKTKTSLLTNKLKILRLIAMSLLFFVSVFSVILFLFIALSPLPKLQEQEKMAKSNLLTNKEDIIKLELVNDRTQRIKSIMAKRSSYEQKLSLIKSKMPHDLQLSSLTVEKRNITMLVSSASLGILDTFLNNLKKAVDREKEFSKVTMLDLSRNDEENTYFMSINVVIYE